MNAIQHHLAATDTLVLVTHKPRLLGLVSRVVVLGPQGIMLDGPRDQVLQRLQQPPAAAPAPVSGATAPAVRNMTPGHETLSEQVVA